MNRNTRLATTTQTARNNDLKLKHNENQKMIDAGHLHALREKLRAKKTSSVAHYKNKTQMFYANSLAKFLLKIITITTAIV